MKKIVLYFVLIAIFASCKDELKNEVRTSNELMSSSESNLNNANFSLSASAPGAVVRKGTNTIDVFARSEANSLLHRSWSVATGWTSWEDLGGNIISAPGPSSRDSQYINVYALGANNHLMQIYWTESEGWSQWIDLGDGPPSTGDVVTSPSSVSRNINEVFVFAGVEIAVEYENIYYKKWTPETGWGEWDLTGESAGSASAPSAIARNETIIDVFVRGWQGRLVHSTYIDDGGWTPFLIRGNPNSLISSAPSAAARSENNIDVFARGVDNNLAQIYWTSSTSEWSSWINHGGTLVSAPTVVGRSMQDLNVFAIGEGNVLLQKYWTEGIGWSPWITL